MFSLIYFLIFTLAACCLILLAVRYFFISASQASFYYWSSLHQVLDCYCRSMLSPRTQNQVVKSASYGMMRFLFIFLFSIFLIFSSLIDSFSFFIDVWIQRICVPWNCSEKVETVLISVFLFAVSMLCSCCLLSANYFLEWGPGPPSIAVRLSTHNSRRRGPRSCSADPANLLHSRPRARLYENFCWLKKACNDAPWFSSLVTWTPF